MPGTVGILFLYFKQKVPQCLVLGPENNLQDSTRGQLVLLGWVYSSAEAWDTSLRLASL